MYRFLLLLAPALLAAGEARYARLGEMTGKVDVQMHAADPWSAAERNLTLTESAWLRTAAASRLEIEFDEGSALRLGPDSLIEVSDYSRLSTGQRVTLLSLDRGVAWFTGEPTGRDALSLAVPGAQIVLPRGARIRLEAGDNFSRVSVIEGTVRFSCSDAELDIREGQSVNVEAANPSRFSLEREIAPMELDRWNEERDKLLAAPLSAAHLPLKYGLADLDGAGEWVTTDLGQVWKPKVADGWAPFQKGRWRWYDALGYTWVSDDSWGWLPYHYGRWTRKTEHGWLWVPPARPLFKPGDVYWLYGRQLAGWGPLAPAEEWSPAAAPQQFLNTNTTYATFVADARVIDPAGFTARPREPLGAAVFALALPSPALLPSRLEARRPALRVGATQAITPVVPGTFDADAMAPPPPEPPPAVVTNPASDAPPVVQPGSMPYPAPYPGPPPPIYYPVPVVVINPPEHPDYSRPNPNSPRPSAPKPQPQPAIQPPPPPARGNTQSNSHAQPTAARPTQPANNPPPVIQPPRLDPPRVGVPAPQRNDRPRVEGLPPRPEQPRSDPPRVERREPKPEPNPEPKPEAKPEPRQPKPESKSEPAKPDAAAGKQARKQ
jgi:hypothetical protein